MKTDRVSMASALISLGYEINRSWQFRLRDERTPSARVNKDGTVHDFGTGWHGDLIDVLQQFHNLDFKEAKKEAERLLGLKVDIDFTKFEKDNGELNDTPLPDSFMKPHVADRKSNFQSYLKELKLLFTGECEGKLLPSAKWENIKEISKKYEIAFNAKSGRLIMPIRDIDGGIKTFWKYKKYGKDFKREDGKVIKHKKVLFTKNRPRPPFAVADLIEFAKTGDSVLVTEGEKDALVALANGQKAICIGGAGASKRLKEKYLHLFKNLKVIIAGDYDDAGKEFNNNLKEQLEPIAKSVVILDWEAKAKKDGFKLHNKFDLADYFAWKNIEKKGHTKKVLLTIQQIKTVEIEVGTDSVDHLNLEKLFNKGEIVGSNTFILKKELK